jgi:hypothetical protein
VKVLHIVLAIVYLPCVVALAQAERTIVGTTSSPADQLPVDRWRTMDGGDPRTEDGLLVCDNGSSTPKQNGLVQVIALDQKTPDTIIVTASARSSAVSGSPDPDYSLYLDIIYLDGTPLWGQSASFRTGAADWHTVQVRVTPSRPIRQVSVYLLLRNHSGKAAFRDITLRQLTADSGACWFDGQLLERAPEPNAQPAFYLRDVAAGSAYVPFVDGAALGTTLQTQATQMPAAQSISINLTDTTGRDRALTLIYALPVGPGDWSWLPSPYTQVAAVSPREYVDATRFAAGNGSVSHYPFAAIAAGAAGRAIAIDTTRPAVFRVGYAAGTRELYLAADVALTPEKPAASFALQTFDFAGQNGFRGAVAAYHAANTDSFTVRVPRQGLWMPFFAISKVQGWEDFAFAFKEGNDETAWDDKHDITTFRYTEPMTWWMSMPPEMPRTLAAAEAQARALAAKGDPDARALLSTGYHDADGRFAGRFRNEPWCNGIVWSMNSAPGLAGDSSHFATKWSATIQQQLYGPDAVGRLDGEYIDSSEGYVTDELDYRRDHFAGMQTPLTFDPVTFRPAIFRGLIAFEYVRAIAGDCHQRGRLAMANGAPDRLPWLTPWLDVMGTETDWNRGGEWSPMAIEEMYYRRALCGGKPYCFLMNSDFDRLTPAQVGKYMQRCLAFGMFPGFFSHNASERQYFSQPDLYNRGRPLFRRYLPIIRRLAEAGWQPETLATTDDPAILVERFGRNLFTIYNPTATAHRVTVRFPAPATNAVFLDGGLPKPLTNAALTLELGPEAVQAVELN